MFPMASRKAIITGAATAGALFAAASDDPANTAAGGEGEWVNVLSSADVEDGRRLIFSGHRAARSEDDLIRAAECDIEANDANRGSLSLRGLGLDEPQAKKLVDLGSSLAEDPVSSLTLHKTQCYCTSTPLRCLHHGCNHGCRAWIHPRRGVLHLKCIRVLPSFSLINTHLLCPSFSLLTGAAPSRHHTHSTASRPAHPTSDPGEDGAPPAPSPAKQRRQKRRQKRRRQGLPA